MQGETIERTTLTVPGLGERDRDRVLDAVGAVAGVRDVEVQPDSHTVQVTYDPREVSVPALQAALVDAGYSIDRETNAGSPDMSADALS